MLLNPYWLRPSPVGLSFGLRSAGINGSTFTSPATWAFGSSNFTAEGWIRNTGALDGQQNRIIRARSTSGQQSGWEFACRPAGADPNVKILRLLLRPVATSTTFDSPSFDMPEGTWCHIAVTVDRSGNAIFYVNGVSIGTANVTAVVGGVGFATPCRLLDSISADGDEFRVWNVIRTPTEIAANAFSALPSPLTQTGLIGYFKCDEGSGTTTTDSTASAIVVTLDSNTTFVAGPP